MKVIKVWTTKALPCIEAVEKRKGFIFDSEETVVYRAVQKMDGHTSYHWVRVFEDDITTVHYLSTALELDEIYALYCADGKVTNVD